ncbi:MAG: membrane integrity-associated transporter subunit PqiC [Burkholderiales bacterium]|nr:MAG: membrane integrity-associated transporter subunit PqiC [Burkholderiales bacterium]
MKFTAALVIAAAALLAGCVSVSVGSSDTPAIVYYVLADARRAAVPTGPPQATDRLAVQGIAGDAIADSLSIVYSRQSSERAFYQFASWSERPTSRIALLAQQRLQAGGRFASVTQLGQPVAADWLLTLALDTLVHDVSVTPGRAQLVLRADLISRRDRSLVAQRSFSAAPPVAEPAAAAAVDAFATATADVLDQLTAWVEATVAANARR